jgi:hypothetical protein
MSATTKMMILGVLGGLTSSSDARAHLWWWGNVSRSRLISHGSSLCCSRCAGPKKDKKDCLGIILLD